MKFIRSLFPHSQIPNIGFFYVLSFFSEFYFIVGNWIFFWLRYMKYGELGVIDSLVFLFGFLIEVPAGAVADKIGRKKTINIAFFSTFLGFLLMATANGKPQLVIGFLVAQIGWAFYSGAAEALAYDTLKENDKEKEFDKVISTSQMLGLTALIIGALIGGFAYTWHFRLPHLLTSMGFGIGFIVSLFLHEPVIDSEHFSLNRYMSQMKAGFAQLLLPAIKPFLPLILVTTGMGFMYGSGILQPAVAQSMGYTGTSISILGAISLFIGAIAVKLVPWMRTHLTDRQGLQALALVYICGFALLSLPLGLVAGGVVMVCISFIRPLTNSWTSVVVNRELPSEYRATALSAIEMIKKIPYILLGSITGILIDNHYLKHFCLSISITIGIIFLLNVFFVKKSGR